MLQSWIAALVVIGIAAVTGRAVTRLAGRERWTGLEPAVGLAAVFALEGLLARVPGSRWGLAAGLAVLLAASLLVLRRPGREDLPRAEPGLAVTLVLAFLLVNVPFAVSGQWGLLGIGHNNDLGLHLAWSDWMLRGIGTAPGDGYPLGPHGLATTLASLPGQTLATVFTGQLIAIVMITAWTAWSAVVRLAGWRRPLAAVLVAFPYLLVSYYAQAAFKELAMALFLLAFVIAIGRALGPREREDGSDPPGRGRRPALVPAVLAAGIVFTYSFPGLVWPAAVLLVMTLAAPHTRARLRPGAIAAGLRRPAVALGVLCLAGILAVLAFVGPFSFGSDFSTVAGSDAFGPVSPTEALGVWLDPDYRLDGLTSTPVPGLLAAVGLLALIAGLWWWLRGGRPLWPAAFLACLLIYLVSLPWMGDYSLAKALVVPTPVVMTVIVVALLAGPAAAGRSVPGIAAGAWTALAVLFIAGAVLSSLLVLRDTPVAPEGHTGQLARLADRIVGHRVLFLGQDRFAQWYLSGTRAGVPLPEFPDPDVKPNPKKPFQSSQGQTPIDFDSFDPRTFARFRYAITTAAGWQSAIPPFFRKVARTADYILWEKTRPPFGRPIMREDQLPAKLVDCEGEAGRYFRGTRGVATVLPGARVIYANEWRPGPDRGADTTSRVTTTLGPGTWRLSFQYFSPFDVRLTAPGYRHRFPASLDGQRLANRDTGSLGQYWAGGLVRVKRRQRLQFTATVAPANPVQRLTGYSRKAQLGRIALLRSGPRERVPMKRICDRWVDFYRPQGTVPAGATPRAGSQG